MLFSPHEIIFPVFCTLWAEDLPPWSLTFLGSQVLGRDGESKASPESPVAADEEKSIAPVSPENLSALHNSHRGDLVFIFVSPSILHFLWQQT